MLYDVKTTRKLEKKIISQNNTELALMFKAGTAIFNHINELNKKDLIILIGPGNNGGDGYALAIQAFLNNYNINCIELIESKGTSKELKLLAKNLGINVWTVNNKHAIKWCRDKQVDGIITDIGVIK